MSKDREQIIDDLYEDLLSKPRQVYSVFSDYYGEDRVELQGVISKQVLINEILHHVSRQAISLSAEISALKYTQLKEKTLFEYTDEELELYFPAIKEAMIANNVYTPHILINFGDVTVTNEYDKSIKIWGVWVKVKIGYDGKAQGIFQMNRSKYNPLQYASNYLHSHIYQIPKDHIHKFQEPCLGRGPIIATISTLSVDCDLDVWRLYCFELDKYIHTESVVGTPYHRLENVKKGQKIFNLHTFNMVVYGLDDIWNLGFIQEFARYFIRQRKLKFNYANGNYGLAMSYKEFIILISNEFITWFNNNYKNLGITDDETSLIMKSVLRKGTLDGNKFYYDEVKINQEQLDRTQGSKICTFKGEDILLEIIDDEDNSGDNYVLLLNPKIAERILFVIITLVNTRYGREQNNSITLIEGTGTEETAELNQRIKII